MTEEGLRLESSYTASRRHRIAFDLDNSEKENRLYELSILLIPEDLSHACKGYDGWICYAGVSQN